MKNFIADVSLDKKIPLNFGSSPDPESGVFIQIRTPDPDHIFLGGRMRSLTAFILGMTWYPTARKTTKEME